MFTAKRLIYELDRKLDRFNGEYKKTIRLENKLNLLNEALNIYFDNRVRIAETNSSVREELRPFEVKEKVLKITSRKDGYVVSEFPKDCYRILRRKVMASREGCPSKELPVYLFQTNDLNNALLNPFWQSSFEWEQIIGDEGANGLYLWHRNEFDIDSVTVDYFKIPEEIQGASMSANGSYLDWNGKKVTKDVGVAFTSAFSLNNLTSIAAIIGHRDLGDPGDYALKLKAILDTNVIYTQ